MNVATGKNGEGDVTLKSFAAISPGSIWSRWSMPMERAGRLQRCRVAILFPDLFVLVSSR